MSSDFDVAALSYKDIRDRVETMARILVSGTGRDKVYRNRIGVLTDIGDIEISAWHKLALDVIDFKGDSAEFRKKLAYVKRQKEYNLCKTETDFLHKALGLFLSEKVYPEKWAAIHNRKRFAVYEDFDVPPDFNSLNWLNSTAEIMEDGSKWIAVITKLGEIQEDLWVDLSSKRIESGGHGQLLVDETEQLRESYTKLLSNGRVDDRFIKLMAIQSVVRDLAGSPH